MFGREGLDIFSNFVDYIGDWTDEMCNLTLDGVIEELGKDSVKENCDY